VQDDFLDVVRQDQRQRLEVGDDLVDVLDDARDGLMLVHHAVDAKRPDGGAAERREEHAAHRVAERVAEPALQWLEAELGDVRVVVALGGFNELRANEPAEIDRVSHVMTFLWSCRLPGIALPRPLRAADSRGSKGPDLGAVLRTTA
jgi:hypothetical protein